MKMRLLFFFLSLVILQACESSRTLRVEDTQTRIILKELDSLAIRYEVLEAGKPIKLTLYVEQPIDHEDAQSATFLQRAHLTIYDVDAPNVLYLSGYAAKPNSFQTEITELLDANQVYVEHRYFGESIPGDSIEPNLLNIHQSVEDIHEVREKLGLILKGPWANTGISKGGQTAMYHKAFYPDDIQASVIYVAPLNMAEEDPRIQQFLDSVGSITCRMAIKALQMELLMNYDLSLAYFKELATGKKMFPSDSWEEFFELSILEYEFAFWQWDANCGSIPGPESELKTKVEHLFKVGSPDFFTSETRTQLFPFFFQAYTEMGMYGYSIEGLEPLTRFFKKDVSNKETFIPDTYRLEYSSSTHQEVKSRLDSLGNNMLYIQGEFDPWSSTSYRPSEQTNGRLFIVEKGNHKSRVKNLPDSDREAIKDSLMNWMKQ